MPTAVEFGRAGKLVLTLDGIQGGITIRGAHYARDAASGLATGKRMWKPLTIIKEWGASSPQLLGLMHSNTSIPEAAINLGDRWVAFHDVTITKISQSSVGSDFLQAITIDFVRAEAGTGAAGRPVSDQQDLVRLMSEYNIIPLNGGTAAEDDWEARV